MSVPWSLIADGGKALGQGFVSVGKYMDDAAALEALKRDPRFSTAFSGGDAQQPMTLASLGQPQPAPQSQQSLSPPGNFPQSLVRTESGGNWAAQNNAVGAGGKAGHFGRLQFGQARLQDAMNAGAIPQGMTPQQFMASPEAQRRAEQWHFADIDRNIQQSGLDKAIGGTINGVPVTLDGMRAVAHLGGFGGLQKFIQTGGAYNPSDANGTSLMSYMQQHGGQQQRTNPLANIQPMQSSAPQQQPMTLAQLSPQPQQPPMNMETLGALMRSEKYAPLATAIMSKQLARDPVEQQMAQVRLMQAQQALAGGNPMQQQLSQAQLEAAQLANQRARMEMTPDETKAAREIQSRAKSAQAMGINPNSPEGQQYALTGKLPENFAGTGEFGKALDKKSAEMFSELIGQKSQAQSDLSDIETMRELLTKVPTGFVGRNFAKGTNMAGIQTEGGAALQQFDAIVSRLVPSQRQPGSGTMSDRDVDLFRSSLPSLLGTPQGNKRIIDTMEGVARYKNAQAEIANRVATGQMSKNDGLKALNSLPNPLEWTRKLPGAQQQSAPAQPSAPQRLGPSDKAAFDAMPSGTRFIDPNGVERIKP